MTAEGQQRARSLLYASLSIACVATHYNLIDGRGAPLREVWHDLLIRNEGPAPNQFRIAHYLVAESLRSLGLSVSAAYLVLRAATTWLAGLLLDRFLGLYLRPTFALAGTALFYGLLPLTYANYFMQETDSLNLCVFLAAYLLMARRRDGWLAGALALGMLNRETPILMPLAWLLLRCDELPLPKLAARAAALGAAVLAPYAGLRWLLGHHTPYYPEAFLFGQTVLSPSNYVYVLVLGVPWVPLALLGMRTAPKEVYRAALFAPYFIVFHVLLGSLQEPRHFLPVLPPLLACALGALGGWAPRGDAASAALSPALRRLAWAGFAAFVGATWLFFSRLETSQEWMKTENAAWAERLMRQGWAAYQQGRYLEAGQKWESALQRDPGHAQAHYNLACLFSGALADEPLARRHLDAFSSAAPAGPQLEALRKAVKASKPGACRPIPST